MLIGRLRTHFSEIFNQNTKLFIHENAPENIVCDMAVIFSLGGDELKSPMYLKISSA